MIHFILFTNGFFLGGVSRSIFTSTQRTTCMNNPFFNEDSSEAKAIWISKLDVPIGALVGQSDTEIVTKNYTKESEQEAKNRWLSQMNAVKQMSGEDAKRVWLARIYRPVLNSTEEYAKKKWLLNMKKPFRGKHENVSKERSST